MGSPSSSLLAEVQQVDVETPVTVVARGKAGLTDAERDELKGALQQGEALVFEGTTGEAVAEVTGVALSSELWVVRRHESLPFQLLTAIPTEAEEVLPTFLEGEEGEADTGTLENAADEPMPPGAKPEDLRPAHETKEEREAADYKPNPGHTRVKVDRESRLQTALGAKNRKKNQSELADLFQQNTSQGSVTGRGPETWYFANQVLQSAYVYGPGGTTQRSTIDVGYFVEQYATDLPKNKWISIKTVGSGVTPTSGGALYSNSYVNRGYYQDLIRVEYGFAGPDWLFAPNMLPGWAIHAHGPPNENNKQSFSYSTSTTFGASASAGTDNSSIGVSAEKTTSNSHEFSLSDWRVENQTSSVRNKWEFKMSASVGAAYDPANPHSLRDSGNHCYIRDLPVLSKLTMNPDTAAVYRGPYDNNWYPLRFEVTQQVRNVWRAYCNHTWYGSWTCNSSYAGGTAQQVYGIWIYNGSVRTAAGG